MGTSEAKFATQIRDVDLNKLETLSGATHTPEKFFDRYRGPPSGISDDRFAELRNSDLNRDRPAHGLDQQSLPSAPNVELGNTSPFFGVQGSVVHLEHLPASSSSLFVPQGFSPFPNTPSDLRTIHSIYARMFPILDSSIIIDMVHNTVNHLRSLEQTMITEFLAGSEDRENKDRVL